MRSTKAVQPRVTAYEAHSRVLAERLKRLCRHDCGRDAVQIRGIVSEFAVSIDRSTPAIAISPLAVSSRKV